MPIDDSEPSLNDGGTFAGQLKVDRDDVSLGGEATFAGASRRRAAEMSLGDERTFGDRLDDQDTVIGDIEVIDLAARYKTEGTLGRGGMGEVLLALDTRLDRKVAIKRILGEAARSKTAVSRFLTEAKAIAALNHPNVVQIYDYGRAEDGPFLIMEYVDGSSLLDRCRDGALPLEEAVNLACQLCDGLGKAHDLGIVHRDIKPANVLLTKDGLPKLTDFGLAKAEATDHQMTMTGAVLGTPDFMPPEQRKDAALVDARSDLWSLAATVYQMVTGRSPKIIRFDLLPAGLTDVLGKALEEAKEDRFQTARELRDALKASLVATAPASAELSAGQCPSCGMKNDSSRRFCRGCGESLEAPCLSCSKPMPMWEEICGQCGTKQGPLLEERRGDMAAQQAEAEGLLKDHDFERAEGIAVALRDEADSRLKQLAPWATAFVPKISAARDAQLAQAASTLAEGLKHEASFDYLSAIHALEQVPEILRGLPLGGQADTVGVVLGRVAARQAEVERLESFVKARIAAKELGGLLREVRKLLELRPDRTDVAKLCTQLEERQQKLVAQRDEALKLARSHLDAKDYGSVVAVLRKVDRSVETPEVGQLRDASAININALQSLMQEISQSVSQKQVDGLIPKVQTALSLSPGHPELLKLLDSLRAREAKVSAGIQHVVAQAKETFKACRFDEAVAILQRISEERRSSEVVDLLDRCEYLAMTKAGVTNGFEGLHEMSNLAEVEGLNLAGLTTLCRSYLGQIAMHGLADPAIEQWCVKCEAAAERRAVSDRAVFSSRNLRRLIASAHAVFDKKGSSGVRPTARQRIHPGFAINASAAVGLVAIAAAIYAAGSWLDDQRQFTNSVGMQFIRISAGQYIRTQQLPVIGWDTGFKKQAGISKQVDTFNNYWIATTEVTQSQWTLVMDTMPWSGNRRVSAGPHRPVVCITRGEAEDFCRRLTTKERDDGVIPVSATYRLPSHVEWEYAVSRGGDESQSKLTSPTLLDNLPSDVALGPSTKSGIYDAFDNVREICSDRIVGGLLLADRAESKNPASPNAAEGDPFTGFRVILSGR